ncbi:MAG: AEC family transporter [Lentisphaeria bacterium]|nr:AEC family transporter [Lentisphaeria bacterium]
MSDFFFALTVVTPTFTIIFIGMLLRHFGVINDDFVKRSSTIVFRIALPALIIVKISQTDLSDMLSGLPVAIFVVWTLIFFIGGWIIARVFIRRSTTRGAFVQGGFRSNIAILGLPIIQDFLGEESLVLAMVYLAVAMPLYNVLAVIVLSATSEEDGAFHPLRVGMNIVKNPLIIAVLIGMLLSGFSIHLPGFALTTITSFSSLTFPLALLGIGASLRGIVSGKIIPAAVAAAVKTALLPACCCLTGYAAGLRGDVLAVMFVVSAAPAAVSSFIMAKAMNSDGDLAAGIVFMSTLMSLGTLTSGIYILRLISRA